ncbi:MAG: hypothetical protein V4641_25580 [Pseudomonadota bacterium]
MLELVQRYYTAERQLALLGAVTGMAMLLGACLLLHSAAVTSLLKGMAYALVVSGSLLASSGLGYAAMVGSRLPAAVAAYKGQSDNQIRHQEVARMENVLASGYTVGLATFTAILLMGLALIFTAQDASSWKGVALVLLGSAG